MKKIFNELQKHNSEHLKILEGTRKTLEKEHERRQKLLEIHDKRMTIELDQILSKIDQKISAFYGLDITPFENTEVAYANIADMNLTTQVSNTNSSEIFNSVIKNHVKTTFKKETANHHLPAMYEQNLFARREIL